MAVYSVHAIALQDLVRSGPDPFASGMSTSGAAIGTSTLRLPSGTPWTELRLNDTDMGPQAFEDTDQTLAAPVSFNGMTWPAGVDVENEYSYVLRPEGATDASQDVTIYALQFNGGAVQGIAASGPIARDVTYLIISGNNSPATSYAALAICFAPGTAIATPGGWRAVGKPGPGRSGRHAGQGAAEADLGGRPSGAGAGRRGLWPLPRATSRHALAPGPALPAAGRLEPPRGAGRPAAQGLRGLQARSRVAISPMARVKSACDRAASAVSA